MTHESEPLQPAAPEKVVAECSPVVARRVGGRARKLRITFRHRNMKRACLEAFVHRSKALAVLPLAQAQSVTAVDQRGDEKLKASEAGGMTHESEPLQPAAPEKVVAECSPAL